MSASMPAFASAPAIAAIAVPILLNDLVAASIFETRIDVAEKDDREDQNDDGEDDPEINPIHHKPMTPHPPIPHAMIPKKLATT